MRVLVVTNMYPTTGMAGFGIFVQEQVECLRKEGVQVDVFFVNGKKNKLNYLWGIFRLWAWLSTHHHYDLIHAHYVFAGIIARTQFLYPVVLTHHGLEVFTGWQRFPSRIISHLVDKVILVSQEMVERLKYNEAVVIPCGINFDLFRPIPREKAREELNLPRDKKLVLWVGQSTRPEKRFDIVKEAVALAQKQDPMIEFVLVSNKPHDIVPAYMSACDVILLVSDAEGSPMVIKEAMACNLPVVSVPVGDVPEVIGGTDGCYLCTQNPSDVAEKLLLALSNDKRTNGREHIRHLEQGNITKRIIAVYQEVLQKKDGQSKPCERQIVESR